MNDDPHQTGSALGGVLRFVGVLAVLALATLAALVVLGVIPAEQLAEYGTKIGLLAGIAVAAVGGIAALMGGGRR